MIACLAALSLCGAGYHTDSLVAASPLGEATKDAELALTMAQEIGWRPAESLSLWNLACCLGPRGLYVSALDCAERAFNIAEEIEHRQWMTAAHWTLGA